MRQHGIDSDQKLGAKLQPRHTYVRLTVNAWLSTFMWRVIAIVSRINCVGTVHVQFRDAENTIGIELGR